MPATFLLQSLNSLTVYFIKKLCDDISVDFTTSIGGIAVGSGCSLCAVKLQSKLYDGHGHFCLVAVNGMWLSPAVVLGNLQACK